jgi:hypothetical protein
LRERQVKLLGGLQWRKIYLVGKATEALTKEIASLISPLLRPGVEIASEIIAQELNYFGLKRRVTILKKQQKLLEDNNIRPKMVSPKLLVPILINGSLEDNDDLIDKWAGLLASAASGYLVHPSFPKILAELTPAEAKILDAMYERLIHTTSDESDLYSVIELRQMIGISSEEFKVIIHNLKRLQLWDVPAYHTGNPLLYIDFTGEINQYVKGRLSSLGQDFVKACRGPSS